MDTMSNSFIEESRRNVQKISSNRTKNHSTQWEADVKIVIIFIVTFKKMFWFSYRQKADFDRILKQLTKSRDQVKFESFQSVFILWHWSVFLRMQLSWFHIFRIRTFVYAIADPNNEFIRIIIMFCKLSRSSFANRICSVSCFTIIKLSAVGNGALSSIESSEQVDTPNKIKSITSFFKMESLCITHHCRNCGHLWTTAVEHTGIKSVLYICSRCKSSSVSSKKWIINQFLDLSFGIVRRIFQSGFFLPIFRSVPGKKGK